MIEALRARAVVYSAQAGMPLASNIDEELEKLDRYVNSPPSIEDIYRAADHACPEVMGTIPIFRFDDSRD